MSDLFGNHIVGFPTRRLKFDSLNTIILITGRCSTDSTVHKFLNKHDSSLHFDNLPSLQNFYEKYAMKTERCWYEVTT